MSLSHCWTPPCLEQARWWCCALEYDPSLHSAVASAGALLGAGVFALAVTGRAGMPGIAAGGLAGAAPTPPWCEHAPLPGFDVVPSLHVTVAVVAGLTGVFSGTAAFAVATPPWWEQAPLPALDIVLSLQVTVFVGAWLQSGTGSASARLSRAIHETRSLSIESSERCDGW